MRITPAACLLSALAACTPEPPPGPARAADGGLAYLPEGHADMAVGLARPDGGSALALAPGGGDAGAPAAGALPILSAETALPDGSAAPLRRDRPTTVEPAARFRMEVAARLADARLSLLDAQDGMVAADGTVEVAATARFTLTPTAPLRPGSSYTLRLDGAEGRLLRAEDGRSFEPVSLAIRTSGSPPPPPRKARHRRPRQAPGPR